MTFFDWLNAVHWVLLPFGPIILIGIFGTIISLLVKIITMLLKMARKLGNYLWKKLLFKP
jgi:hypothetical protein